MNTEEQARLMSVISMLEHQANLALKIRDELMLANDLFDHDHDLASHLTDDLMNLRDAIKQTVVTLSVAPDPWWKDLKAEEHLVEHAPNDEEGSAWETALTEAEDFVKGKQPETFHERLRGLMSHHGVTPKWVAEAVGLSPSTVYRLAGGEGDPRNTTVKKLAMYFDIPPSDLDPEWTE